MKRTLCIILTMFITLNMGLSAFSASTYEDQINLKTNVLNQIKLLYGDGTGYNLDKQITRSEAAAFIVRLLGKENEIKANQEKYNKSNFKDVLINEWYTSYVAYCYEKGIINGFEDFTYRPNDYVSEKAFLTLVLGAIGYVPNIDFTWSNVYKKALEVGLVKDQAYNSKVIDRTNYYRGDAVDILYTSLTLKKKASNQLVIDSIIDSGVITKDTAKELGLLNDFTETKIESIIVNSATSITITFNEIIAGLLANQIKLYESNNSINPMDITIESVKEREVVLEVSSPLQNALYTLEINDLIDIEGFKSTISNEFTSNISQEVISDYFKISKIQSVSKNVINVYFTQPINLSAELPMNYEIFNNNTSYIKGDFSNLSVKLLGGTDNAVSIYTKTKSFVQGETYNLNISGSLVSLFGATLREGSGDKQDFQANVIDNEDLYVKSVYPIDNKTIEVEFNKDIDLTSVQNIGNYSLITVNGPPRAIINAVASTESNKSFKYVQLSIAGTFDSAQMYELTLKNTIKDSFNEIALTESKFLFSGNTIPKKDLQIINVTAEDNGTILVYVDRPLNVSDATNTGLFSVIGVTDGMYSASPSRIHYNKNDPYRLKLYLPIGKELVTNQTYKLQILNIVKDMLGNSSVNNIMYEFTGNGQTNMKPFMYEAKIIAKDMIKVKLTEEISELAPNTLTTNYVLEYKEGSTDKSKTPTSVNLVDPTTLILKFDTLNFSTSYTLKFTSMADYPGINTRTAVDGLNQLGVTLGQ